MHCQLPKLGTQQPIQSLSQQVGRIHSALGILNHEKTVIVRRLHLNGCNWCL
jgi:hypothetical protein